MRGVWTPLLALLLCPTAAIAGSYPSCPFKVDGAVRPLSAMLSCQQGARIKYLDDYAKSKGREAPIYVVDGLDGHQRAEIRSFLQKHPDQATFAETEEAEGASADAGFFSQISSIFGIAQAKLESFFGSSSKPKAATSLKNEEVEATEAIAALDKAGISTKGLNLKSIMDKAKDDPAGAVKGAVETYNKDLDKNLDPSMKHFWDKPKK